MSIKRKVKRVRVNRLAKAFKKGHRAYWRAAANGRELETNPYQAGTDEFTAWAVGVEKAAKGMKI